MLVLCWIRTNSSHFCSQVFMTWNILMWLWLMNGMNRTDTILHSRSPGCNFALPEDDLLIPLRSFCIHPSILHSELCLATWSAGWHGAGSHGVLWRQLVVLPIGEKLVLKLKNAQMQILLNVPNVIMVSRAWCMNELESYITALGFAMLWLDILCNRLTCGEQYLNKLQPIILKSHSSGRFNHNNCLIFDNYVVILKKNPSYWEKDKGSVWSHTIFHLYMLHEWSAIRN